MDVPSAVALVLFGGLLIGAVEVGGLARLGLGALALACFLLIMRALTRAQGAAP